MIYTPCFKHADDAVVHLRSAMPYIADPLSEPMYVGFMAVVATTAYEIAIKEIFINFAKKKHKVFGNFTKNHFDRINGRITIAAIKGEHLKRFGDVYLRRFEKKLDDAEKEHLKLYRRSIKTAYSNIIEWRNNFVHGGKNTQATCSETISAYEDGKKIIHSLSEAMIR
ncbi:MAG: hypothetical protein LBI35_04050 [Burkholderiales bacterium]|jgi:hypothetical protein|nr:hypothetical protein [Burkholderiales bacterium]